MAGAVATVRTVPTKTPPVMAARKLAKMMRMRMECRMIRRTSLCLATKSKSSRKITTRRS